MTGVWDRQRVQQQILGEADGTERPGPQRDSGYLLALQFYPNSGPLRGSTRLTLCGSNFYLHPAGPLPEGTHLVTVGRSPCRLLAKESSNFRYNRSLPFVSLMGETKQSLFCETLSSSYWGPWGKLQWLWLLCVWRGHLYSFLSLHIFPIDSWTGQGWSLPCQILPALQEGRGGEKPSSDSEETCDL